MKSYGNVNRPLSWDNFANCIYIVVRKQNHGMSYLTVWDLVLTPFYLLILHFIAKRQRDSRYPAGHPLRQYFLPGLYVKLGGAIFIALVYQFYYGGGDTFNFFYHSQIINSSLNDSFSTWIKLLMRTSPDEAPEIYLYTSQLYWYQSPEEYLVAVVAAIFGLLNGTTYLPIALMFAYFSFTGVWALFRTFANIYPKAHRYLSYAFLFIPSTFVWGSAIFKDTLCMFGLGWLTYTTFRIFVNKDFSLKNIFLLVLSFWLVASVKLYILMAFLPALGLWLLMTYSGKIAVAGLRWIVNLLFVGVIAGSFLYFSDRFAKDLSKYSLEELAYTAEVTRSWTNYASGDEGSSYNIGTVTGSSAEMLALFPKAVVVTFFRPFPWEARKVIVVLSALEALLFLYFTVTILLNRKSKLGTNFIKDPNIIFCFLFALIFAFAVGVSSGNFGALSRYKIPCLPFYGAFLAILYSKQKLAEENKKKVPYKKYPQPAVG